MNFGTSRRFLTNNNVWFFLALYENLLIDGYFTDVLTSKQLPHDEHEIVLQSDASWESLVPAKTKTEPEKEEKPVPIKT